MKKPLLSRLVTPGAPDALDRDELGLLRDLPGPRRSRPRVTRRGRKPPNRAMLAADAVLGYWARDSQRESQRQAKEAKEASKRGGGGDTEK